MQDVSAWIAFGSLVVSFIATFSAVRSSRRANEINQDANNIKWLEQARHAAQVAETKADDAERRATALMNKMLSMERRIVSLESKMRYLVALIHTPYMTIDLLRETVPESFARSTYDHESGGSDVDEA